SVPTPEYDRKLGHCRSLRDEMSPVERVSPLSVIRANHPKVPCATRLVERKVDRVVIGILDPDNRISGRGQRMLRKAGIVAELFPHDLMAEVEEMNRDFMRDRESQESRQSAKSSAPPKLRVALKR